MIRKNEVKRFGCERVALGYEADASITFFMWRGPFDDDVYSVLKHKI